MPATPRDFTLTADELADALRVTGTGGATPYFEGDQYPRMWDINELRNRPRAKWLIGNVLEEKGLTVFFGPDKVGKTAAVSSLLWAWCAGHDHWLNEELTLDGPEDRRVMYVLLEGQSSFYDRYDAWTHVYNEGEPIEGFLVMDEGLSLYEGQMKWEQPETWTPSAKKLWNAVEDFRPHILVVDTLSRSTAGMDENSPQMAQVVGMLDNIRDVYEVATIIVHHTSLSDGDRPRGHSSLKGAASSYVRIEGKPEDDVLQLVTGPHRNSDIFLRIKFTRESKRAAFVLKSATGPAGRVPKKEQLFSMVIGFGGELDVNEATKRLYPEVDHKTLKSCKALARDHDQLEYVNGFIRRIEAEEPEEL